MTNELDNWITLLSHLFKTQDLEKEEVIIKFGAGKLEGVSFYTERNKFYARLNKNPMNFSKELIEASTPDELLKTVLEVVLKTS